MVDQDSQRLEAARHDVLADNTAQTVFKHLTKLANEESRFRKRWVWELMQNASDAAPGNGVNVELLVDQERLVFRHNGAPFALAGIAHLIYHGSTKYDGDDRVGQFGTGFITTHLLSKQVNVRGRLDDGRSFDFMLNRAGTSSSDLSKAMEESWKGFVTSLTATDLFAAQHYTTQYTYSLDQRAQKAVEEGTDDLTANAPLVLAFNSRIRSIHIPNHHSVEAVYKQDAEPLDKKWLKRVRISQQNKDGQLCDRYVALLADANICIAVDLLREDEIWRVEARPSAPRVFIAFPLTGTEDFALPVIVNSVQLKPREDRDSLSLSGDSDTNALNRSLIAAAAALVPQLAAFAADKGWAGASALSLIPEPGEKEWLDAPWMKKTLWEKVIEPLRGMPVLRNAAGSLVSPSQAWIPVPCNAVSASDMWSIVSSLAGAADKLPTEAEATAWGNNLLSWNNLRHEPVLSFNESFDLMKLCSIVAAFGSVSKLRETLAEGTKPIEWINQLHVLIAKADRTKLFDEQRLLPDQNGDLKTRRELKRDDAIDTDLKTISEGLGIGIRSRLLDTGISLPYLLKMLDPTTTTQLLNEALVKLKDLARIHPKTDHFRRGSVSLFTWLASRGEIDSLDGFSVYTRAPLEGDSVRTLKKSAPPLDDAPLGPVGCWPEKARKFAHLFPLSHILADDYLTSTPTETWKEIAAGGLVRLSPLFTARQSVRTFIPDDPLPEKDEKGTAIKHKSKALVEATSISFLEREGTGLDATRKSKSRALELLSFLVTFVMEEDCDALKTPEIECECGEKHRYYRAGWLGPLFENKWVPFDSKQSYANAESLAKLLKDQKEQRALLTGEAGRKLLYALKISLADLLLRTVAEDDAKRVSYIHSASELMRAVGDDAEKAQLVASELNHSRNLIKDILRHRDEREKVRRNKEVGAAVEAILKSELEKGQGLRITRTGVGSDFVVANLLAEEDDDILLEVTNDIGSFLLEIKSTTLTSVHMTVPQARTAVDQRDRFILCMVKIDAPAITAEMVRQNSRFIADIGDRLDHAWTDYCAVESAKLNAKPCDGVELVMTETQTRFAVSDTVWAGGINIDEFCKRVIRGD